MAKLYFYYSAMNAGKSTTLLQSAHNYRERGMHVLLFTPSVDNRYAEGAIHSRIGLMASAISFDHQFDFFEFIQKTLTHQKNTACILIDEAQFLTQQQIHQLTQVCDELKLPVLAYGLRTDFQGEPFEGSKYLLALAEELVEIKTVCHCGRKAIMNMRIDEQGNKITQGEQVHIGGNECYVSTCRKHFKAGMTQS